MSSIAVISIAFVVTGLAEPEKVKIVDKKYDPCDPMWENPTAYSFISGLTGILRADIRKKNKRYNCQFERWAVSTRDVLKNIDKYDIAEVRKSAKQHKEKHPAWNARMFDVKVLYEKEFREFVEKWNTTFGCASNLDLEEEIRRGKQWNFTRKEEEANKEEKRITDTTYQLGVDEITMSQNYEKEKRRIAAEFEKGKQKIAAARKKLEKDREHLKEMRKALAFEKTVLENEKHSAAVRAESDNILGLHSYERKDNETFDVTNETLYYYVCYYY
ncbi:unnamed protein product [Cylicocyclus nassatus]|uniref:Uncharacterized protein n=1 Tax=Cylicocyclus nassatus TaxID=53992 RepID=A0AA36GQU0_CYLNA|nr:unnamed protein product [Cylicocyclus nassatus]